MTKWTSRALVTFILCSVVPVAGTESASPGCSEYEEVVAAQDEAIKAAEEEIASLRLALAERKAEVSELRVAIYTQRQAAETYRLLWVAEVEYGKAAMRRARWLRGLDGMRWFGVGVVGGYALNEAVGP